MKCIRHGQGQLEFLHEPAPKKEEYYSKALAIDSGHRSFLLADERLSELSMDAFVEEQSESLIPKSELSTLSPMQVGERFNTACFQDRLDILFYAISLAYEYQQPKPEFLNALIFKLREVPENDAFELLITSKIGMIPGIDMVSETENNALNFISLLIRILSDRCPRQLKFNFIILIMKFSADTLQELGIDSPIEYSCENDDVHSSERSFFKDPSVIEIIAFSFDPSKINPSEGVNLLPEFYFKLSPPQQEKFKTSASLEIKGVLPFYEQLHAIFQFFEDDQAIFQALNNPISGQISNEIRKKINIFIQNISHQIELLRIEKNNMLNKGLLEQCVDSCYAWISDKLLIIFNDKIKKSNNLDLKAKIEKKLSVVYVKSLENISFSSIDLCVKAQTGLVHTYCVTLGRVSQTPLNKVEIDFIDETLTKLVLALSICYMSAKYSNRSSEIEGLKKPFFLIIEIYFRWNRQGPSPAFSNQEPPKDWWVDQWWLRTTGQGLGLFSNNMRDSFFSSLQEEFNSKQRSAQSESYNKDEELPKRNNALELIDQKLIGQIAASMKTM